jgi:ribose 5-phosphate isomerase B
MLPTAGRIAGGRQPAWAMAVDAAGGASHALPKGQAYGTSETTASRELAMANPIVALVADHAGLELKKTLKGLLDEQGFETVDLGPDTAEPVDYPDMADRLAAALKDGRAQVGVMTCGSGIGIAIAANRYPWIRAAMCYDVTTARLAREHNDANVLALGARLLGLEVARDCLLTFLNTPFAGGRHARRVAKMSSPQA